MAPPSVQVRSVVITPEVLTRRIRALGTLRADETTQVSAEIAGRITEINFEEGQRVEKGQSLFQLDDRIDRADLARAEAQLAQAKRSHDRATELSGRSLLSKAELDQTLLALRVAEAEVTAGRTRVEKARVPAPFSGWVGLRQVSPGAYVSPGQALVNLEAIDRIKLDFRVPEAE
ncbi:MAG: efflux RND transporter periplasmic adaptor subunit, partial [Polycyclovorans sp.]